MAADDEAKKSRLEDLSKTVKGLLDPIGRVEEAMLGMYDTAHKLNEAFIGGRVRMDEMMDAASKAAARVIGLGGNVNNLAEVMKDVAEGSRRNVIATEEQVGKLYAAFKILGEDSKTLVENFANAGYETSQIGVNLEKSIAYIQSVGGNTRAVTKEVVANMEQMNRYQFEGGVQGLAKMAAQASMLRFDMSQTFSFTNRMLTPENAINMAAAFQRLGVAAGNLTDPFALMNQSINDPTGLQNSLARLGQEFTYFDEETQSFKINPQGVLTLRQMEEEAGLAAGSLSKSALAAAELDKRVSKISPSLNFKNEEDKQLLANMATMEGGEYVVQIKDDQGGIVETKKLTDVTQEEFDKMREQQAKAPKTLEDIQRSQLDVTTRIEALVKGSVSRATYGIAGSDIIRSNIGGAERVIDAVGKAMDATIPESRKISEKINDTVAKLAETFRDKETGQISSNDFENKVKALQEEIKQGAISMGKDGVEAMKNILAESNKNISGSSLVEKIFKDMSGGLMKITGTEPITTTKSKTTTKSEPVTTTTSSIFGKLKQATESQQLETTKQVNSKVDLGGTLTIKVETPAGISEQYFKTFFQTEEFKKMVYNYYNQKAKELERQR
jgi:hypothetical protein